MENLYVPAHPVYQGSYASNAVNAFGSSGVTHMSYEDVFRQRAFVTASLQHQQQFQQQQHASLYGGSTSMHTAGQPQLEAEEEPSPMNNCD